MSAPLQSPDELDRWYGTADPWRYEENPDDARRRDVLLSELPERPYRSVLDIGCGEGFITRRLPGERILAVDLSEAAILRARERPDPRIEFRRGDIFGIVELAAGERFDLVVITGVLYPQYIGAAHSLVYHLVDQVLAPGGVLASVHIDEWYRARFPFLLLDSFVYPYREHLHRIEVYAR